jgi:purine nucleosidase/pyrimidine-specific ribonucleoside hydrolase
MTEIKRKIIIDTDIGDDIDDALAISLALQSPEIDLIGITTVYKNTLLRAKIARRLLKAFNRDDVPVTAGLGKPLINSVDINSIPCQYSEEMECEKPSCGGDAVDFIIEKLEASEGDITLVPIGPLTNIAAILIKKPDIKDKIKSIVLMGGAYFLHANEWNILCDPEAARIVFDSGVKITAVGLDVTLKCILGENDIQRIKNYGRPHTDLLYKLIRLWNGNILYLHDPLAVAVCIDESLVKQEKAKIHVETRGEYSRGTTFNATDHESYWGKKCTDSNTGICCEVDSERFVKLFMDRILD